MAESPAEIVIRKMGAAIDQRDERIATIEAEVRDLRASWQRQLDLAHDLITEREARIATLEAALREIPTVRDESVMQMIWQMRDIATAALEANDG